MRSKPFIQIRANFDNQFGVQSVELRISLAFNLLDPLSQLDIIVDALDFLEMERRFVSQKYHKQLERDRGKS